MEYNITGGRKMKQKKVKKELVLTTYKDYVRHYGVKLGAKKWKARLVKPIKITDPTDGAVHQTAVIEEVRVEEIPVEKAKGNIRYRADKIRETLLTTGWIEYIKPRIQACIDLYKSVYDDVPSYEELKVNQAVRKELKAILQDIDGWIIADLELKKEEEKNAADGRRKKSVKGDDSPVWQSER